MFIKGSSVPSYEALSDVRQKTLAYGEKTLLAEFRLAKGAEVPEHSHPHEQTGYLVSGRIDLTLSGETYEVQPGDSWSIPGNLPHKAKAHEESIVIEVFSPVREEYLPGNGTAID